MIEQVIAKKEAWIRENLRDGTHLTILTDHSDDASEVYMRNKKRKCEEFGIGCDIVNFDEYDHKKPTTGMIVQLPTQDKRLQGIADTMQYWKDVDALTHFHSGLNFEGNETILPCTVQACVDMIEHKHTKDLSGLHVLVIGRSTLVGKPLAVHLINRGCTVTTANSRTNVEELVDDNDYDVIVVATGCHGALRTSWLQAPDQLILDVGINRVDGKLTGDVLYDSNVPAFTYITPVPKGIGRLTVLNVAANLIKLKGNQQ